MPSGVSDCRMLSTAIFRFIFLFSVLPPLAFRKNLCVCFEISVSDVITAKSNYLWFFFSHKLQYTRESPENI